MKIMIVSGSREIRQATAKVLGVLLNNLSVVATNHDEALKIFLFEEPDRVLVCEYDELGEERDKYSQGKFTYRDIKNSASEDLVIIRSGFSSYDYDDYIKMPFLLENLVKKLQIEKDK